MTAEEMQALRDRCAEAAGGRPLRAYKLSLQFDNPAGPAGARLPAGHHPEGGPGDVVQGSRRPVRRQRLAACPRKVQATYTGETIMNEHHENRQGLVTAPTGATSSGRRPGSARAWPCPSPCSRPRSRRQLELSNTGPDQIPHKPSAAPRRRCRHRHRRLQPGRCAVPQGSRSPSFTRRSTPASTFFDNAWEYHDGKSEEWMGQALKGRRDKVFLMTKVCTHGRDKKVAHAATRRVAEAACRPTTSTCGRSTSASTTTIPSGTSPRAA